MPSTYDIGALVRVSGTFATTAGIATDPTTITLRVRNPGEAVTVYTSPTDAIIVRDSVGAYHADLAAAATGVMGYRWEGTGVLTAAGEGEFIVRDSEFYLPGSGGGTP